MNLICFPHYTCGGLLCDMLNDTFSPIQDNGGIGSIHHAIGKIGDTNTILTSVDTELFIEKTKHVKEDEWVGTHCWPGGLPLDKINKIINITTATDRSRVYRWSRAYHLYFKPQWNNMSGIDLIDKIRETAKNYIIEFPPMFDKQVYNLEFSEVVESTNEFKQLFKNYPQHMSRWQEINSFLYSDNFWNSPEVKAYYQAEYEVKLKKYYVYE